MVLEECKFENVWNNDYIKDILCNDCIDFIYLFFVKVFKKMLFVIFINKKVLLLNILIDSFVLIEKYI